MFIEKIYLNNFRNHENINLEFNKFCPINIIIAPNGTGKSNLLEAIYYLSYLRPFRNVSDAELIKKGSNSFSLAGKFIKNNISTDINIKYSKTKEILLNNKKIKKHSEILGLIITVLFCNDDIFIINGNPLLRRRFFDMFISILDKTYLFALKKYQVIIKQRNYILKNNTNFDMLDVYDFQLSQCIEYITKKRIEIVQIVSSLFQQIYQEIGCFKDKTKIIFQSSLQSDNKDEILKKLKELRKKDIENGFTSFGSHKDSYLFLLNGINFSKYASFGQTRLASLVLKLAQIEIFEKSLKINPILLLDDVVLELDLERQKRFISFLSKKTKQMFITITDEEKFNFFNSNKEFINKIEL